MTRTIYIVGCLKDNLVISAIGPPAILLEVPCAWAAGMCGAFPAFWDRKDAEAYQATIGDHYPIEEFTVETPTIQ